MHYVRKARIPWHEEEAHSEKLSRIDLNTIVGFVRDILFVVLKLKRDAEAELDDMRERECSDYESMLQKLEGECRQHIRVSKATVNLTFFRWSSN